ncbi:glucose 1-dehydrogenase [Rhodospirillaceae bacterium SYSU D60014]|uniref:SDR family NAD(P)-dependent oxidoreductase n=1 Tax=Virgifigura deserti TaxID=2268457 RepID=UPI000E662783
MKLDGKIVLVTGATSGIGAAIAAAMATEGAIQMLSGRSAQRGEAVRRRVEESGGQATFLAGDLAEPGFAERLVAATLERFGRLDILVNNAGLLFRGTIDRCSDEEWHRTMAVNLHAVFYLSRAAVREMKRQGGGAIVNIASDWGLVGGRNALAYCASKGAVVQITKSLALDHAPDGIRVNAVCPGDTATPMLDSAIALRGVGRDEGLAQLGAAVPMGRVATPEEIAKSVVFLASDDASYITGATLAVDGGHTAG